MFSKRWLYCNLCLLIVLINTLVKAEKITVTFEELFYDFNGGKSVTFITETLNLNLENVIPAAYEKSSVLFFKKTPVQVAIKMVSKAVGRKGSRIETSQQFYVNEFEACAKLRGGLPATETVLEKTRLPIIYGFGIAIINKEEQFVMVMEQFQMNFKEYRERHLSSATEASANFVNISKAFSIGSQLLPILRLCRKKGVVHLDIKPENIMLNVNPGGQVTDIVLINYESAYYAGSTILGEIRGTIEYNSYSSHTDKVRRKQGDNITEYRKYDAEVKEYDDGSRLEPPEQPHDIKPYSVKDDLESLFFVLFNSAIKELPWLSISQAYRASLGGDYPKWFEENEENKKVFEKIQFEKNNFKKEIEALEFVDAHKDLKAGLISLWDDIRTRREDNDDDFKYDVYLDKFNTISNMCKVVK